MGGMVWSARELHYGHVTLIEVGDESPTGEDVVRLTIIGMVVGEGGGEVFPTGVIFEIFEFGGGKTWKNFVRSGAIVL